MLRARMAQYAQSLPPEQSQRVVILMRRSEFNYQIYILVLESDGPPPGPSFMRTESPQPRVPRKWGAFPLPRHSGMGIDRRLQSCMKSDM